MQKVLTFINGRGETIVFDRQNYLFTTIEGFGDVEADVQMQKSPYQDGSTYVDSVLSTRPISFMVSILAKDEEDLSNKRSYLARIFNPKLGIGKLIYQVGTIIRTIEVVSEHVPKYGAGFENRGSKHQKSLIDLTAPNPYWRSTSITEDPAFEPLFQFPFEGEFEMGMQRDRRIINNDGDAPAPLFVEFFGPALNPKIINNTTGEYIKINQQLHENERMLIDTTDGKKSVFFVDSNGNQRNVFNWIDLNSTFFKLDIGKNDIEYTADSDIQGAIVNISYSKLYAAI